MKKNSPGCNCCGCIPSCDSSARVTQTGPTDYSLNINNLRPFSRSGELSWNTPNILATECCNVASSILTDPEEDWIDTVTDSLIKSETTGTIDFYCGLKNCSSAPTSFATGVPFTGVSQQWIYYRLKTRYSKIFLTIAAVSDTWANASPEWRGDSYVGSRCGLELLVHVEMLWQSAEAGQTKVGIVRDSFTASANNCTSTGSQPAETYFAGNDPIDQTPPSLGALTTRWMARRIFLPDYYALPTGVFLFPSSVDTAVTKCEARDGTRAPDYISTNPAQTLGLQVVNNSHNIAGATPGNCLGNSHNIIDGWCISESACPVVPIFFSPICPFTPNLPTFCNYYPPGGSYMVQQQIPTSSRTHTGFPRPSDDHFDRVTGTWSLTLS